MIISRELFVINNENHIRQFPFTNIILIIKLQITKFLCHLKLPLFFVYYKLSISMNSGRLVNNKNTRVAFYISGCYNPSDAVHELTFLILYIVTTF